MFSDRDPEHIVQVAPKIGLSTETIKTSILSSCFNYWLILLQIVIKGAFIKQETFHYKIYSICNDLYSISNVDQYYERK